MKYMKPASTLLLAMLFCASPRLSLAQTSPVSTAQLHFQEFMREVEASNLDYAAQRYSVSVAKAQLAAAKLFLPNPQLQLGYSSDTTPGRPRDQRESTVSSVGLAQSIELGGKRGNRVEAARHNLLAASATLEDFWRNLRSTAAAAFIDARVKQLIAERMEKSADSFDQVAGMVAHRVKAGDAGEIDAAQARVDALQFRSQYLQAKSAADNATILLSQLLGSARANCTIVPETELNVPVQQYQLPELLARALSNRPDVISAREAHDAALASVRLARSNRIPDVGLGVTYTRTGSSSNITAPYDKTDMLGISANFELPVFTSYRHELEAARALEMQADRQYQAALLKAQIDVRSAHTTYVLAVQQIAQYNTRGALSDAEDVLKARNFGYEHGQNSLLDVLQAQRDLNDVYLNYFSALENFAVARVNLQQAIGAWDLDL